MACGHCEQFELMWHHEADKEMGYDTALPRIAGNYLGYLKCIIFNLGLDIYTVFKFL